MAKRPPIPAGLERQVLTEAGHRCAIHTCRQVPVEIAHIVPWAQCHSHDFLNLIALRPTCHTRYDKGHIDRRAMMAYKRAAWWRNAQYSDLERRLLLRLAAEKTSEAWIFSGLGLLLAQLISDGLLLDTGTSRPDNVPETFRDRLFKLTAAGDSFVHALREPDGEIP